jgi:hypothetical protein
LRSYSISGAAVALLAFAVVQTGTLPAVAAESSGGKKVGSSASILIKASPKTVWRAVHNERNHNPEVEYSKVLESSGNTSVIEQKFTNIPILGSVVAVTHQTEVPMQRIDYKMVRSDKFKALEGSWILTPANGGTHTELKLSSHLDVGVPFSGMFIKNATKKKLERRLSNVKSIAEREQARIAAGGGEQ